MCPRHHSELQDACPRCGAPFVPHRTVRRNYRCSACQMSLTAQSRSGDAYTQDRMSLLQLQEQMLEDLEAPNLPREPSHHRPDLLGLRQLVSLLFTEPYAERAYEILGLPHSKEKKPCGRLELARHSYRMRVLTGCHALVTSWPQSFRLLADEFGITQRRFATQQPCSAWIAQEVTRLPPGNARGKSVQLLNIEKEIAQLHEKRPKNWRATRANIMICGKK